MNRYIPDDFSPVKPAVLRLAIGSVFIGAGLQKLLGIWGGTGISGTTALFQAIHLSPAYPLAVFITGLELVGGLLLIVGAFTICTAALLVIEMVVAILEGAFRSRLLPELDAAPWRRTWIRVQSRSDRCVNLSDPHGSGRAIHRPLAHATTRAAGRRAQA